MNNTEIRDRFRQEEQTIIIDDRRKADAMTLFKKNIAEKQIHGINSKMHILLNQLRYMDKKAMLAHALFCVVLLLVIMVMKRYGVDKDNVISCSVILSGVLGIVSVAGISRIFFSGIAEIGESCYFNVRQIVALHMSISGIINLTGLSVGIIFVGIQWKIKLLQAGLYILTPFVAVQCCCLHALLTKAGRKNSYSLIMLGIFLIILYAILVSIPNLYNIAASAVWMLAFITGVLLLGIEIRLLFKGIKKGEILCMN